MIARLVLALCVLAAGGCGSTPADPDRIGSDTDDTASGDVAEDGGEDTSVDDATEDIDAAEDVDAEDVAEDGDAEDAAEDGDPEDGDPEDADVPIPDDPCEPPLRARPVRGDETGGTIIEVVGQEFYIGALGWWLDLEDQQVLGAAWEVATSECALLFVTQPGTGSAPMRVWYGGPEGGSEGGPGGQPGPEPFGTFEFVAPTERAASGSCTRDDECTGPFERCHVGLGGCVVDRCASASCGGSWFGGPCSTLRGCIDEPECATDDDCRLLRSSCSCVAVPSDDPATTLDACLYDGCDECGLNFCDGAGARAACSAEGVCEVVAGD